MDCSNGAIYDLLGGMELTDCRITEPAGARFNNNAVRNGFSVANHVRIERDNVPVGISDLSVSSTETAQPQGVYDLTGRRVSDDASSSMLQSSLPKGLYIINGKKVLIR